jgi:hypothetical protein
MFFYCFDMLMLKNKKYYFNIFSNKKYFKKNYYNNTKHNLNIKI